MCTCTTCATESAFALFADNFLLKTDKFKNENLFAFGQVQGQFRLIHLKEWTAQKKMDKDKHENVNIGRQTNLKPEIGQSCPTHGQKLISKRMKRCSAFQFG